MPIYLWKVKKMKKSKVLVFILAAVFALSLIAGCGGNSKITNGDTTEKKIKATLTIVYEDKTSKDVTLEAGASDSLGDAMYAAKLISLQEYTEGYLTEVDGVIADWNKDQAWWCLEDKDGKSLSVGIKDIKLSDGDSYKIVYTIGME